MAFSLDWRIKNIKVFTLWMLIGGSKIQNYAIVRAVASFKIRQYNTATELLILNMVGRTLYIIYTRNFFVSDD